MIDDVDFEMLTLHMMVDAKIVGGGTSIRPSEIAHRFAQRAPRMIIDTTIGSSDRLDTVMLERFSMEWYTNGLLGAFEGQTARETTFGGA